MDERDVSLIAAMGYLTRQLCAHLARRVYHPIRCAAFALLPNARHDIPALTSDAIADLLIPLLESQHPSSPLNLLKDLPALATELSETYFALKCVYAKCIEWDVVAPAIGASVEWMKAVGGKDLPTDFEELELDYVSRVLSWRWSRRSWAVRTP